MNLSNESSKNKINHNYNIELLAESENTKWKNLLENIHLIPEIPRKSAVAMFKLLTGHDCLSKHLHRIDILTSPNCLLCCQEQEMDIDHLASCTALQMAQDMTSKYWEARRRMTSLLNQEH